MTRTPLALLAAAALTVAGCDRGPTSPSASPVGSTSLLAAKPGSGPPSTSHGLTFSAPDASPYLVGTGTVFGWITGSGASGDLLMHATASAFAVTIQAAAEGGPAQDAECTDGTLAGLGLIGGEIAGSFTIDFDQNGSKSITDPLLDWTLNGVSTPDGAWDLTGLTTTNYVASVVDDSASSLTVANNYMKVIFSGPPSETSGRKKSTHVSYACRVNVLMTITK